MAESPAAALAEPAAASLAEPAAAALPDSADAALAEPAAALPEPAATLAETAAPAAFAEPVTALAVTQPLADATAANPHAASLAEAPHDAKAPLLVAVVVSKPLGSVADLLGAAAAEPAVADPAAAEPAADVVATPSVIILPGPPNASTMAAALAAVVARPPELVPAANLAEPTAATVAESAAALPFTVGAGMKMPVTTMTGIPNTAPAGFITASQLTELPEKLLQSAQSQPHTEGNGLVCPAVVIEEGTSDATEAAAEGNCSQSPPAFSKEATTGAAAARGLNSEPAAVCNQQDKKAAAEAVSAPAAAPNKDVRTTAAVSSAVSSSSNPHKRCSYYSGKKAVGPSCQHSVSQQSNHPR
ncbi:TPA: hypothetical protein ACH3X1_000163 [Trebouxia sp. C0004]